jgi:hypothetical protein
LCRGLAIVTKAKDVVTWREIGGDLNDIQDCGGLPEALLVATLREWHCTCAIVVASAAIAPWGFRAWLARTTTTVAWRVARALLFTHLAPALEVARFVVYARRADASWPKDSIWVSTQTEDIVSLAETQIASVNWARVFFHCIIIEMHISQRRYALSPYQVPE